MTEVPKPIRQGILSSDMKGLLQLVADALCESGGMNSVNAVKYTWESMGIYTVVVNSTVSIKPWLISSAPLTNIFSPYFEHGFYVSLRTVSPSAPGWFEFLLVVDEGSYDWGEAMRDAMRDIQQGLA